MKNTPEAMLQAILQVRAGTLTATAAAERLGLSRKTYYEWEARALSGMLAALQPGHAGRPRTAPDPETTQLREQLERLERENELLEQRLRIRETLGAAQSRPQKKRSGD